MLPDAASGAYISTLAPPAGGAQRKKGMARVFGVLIQSFVSIASVAAQIIPGSDNSQGVGFYLDAGALPDGRRKAGK